MPGSQVPGSTVNGTPILGVPAIVGRVPASWVARTPIPAAALVWVTGLKPARISVTFTVTVNRSASPVGVYDALVAPGTGVPSISHW